MKTQKRYKFLNAGLVSEHKGFTWEIGKWYKIKGKLEICSNGFHCSKEIGQAFSYVKGEVLAEVEVRGESVEESDKDAWEEMRIVKAWNWEKKNSVAIAIYSAQLCIENYEKLYPDNKAPRLAIEAAKKWLRYPTEANMAAASSSAAYASSAASSSAAYAASSSAAASASSAAAASASSAASAAYAAAASSASSAAYAAYASSSAFKKIYKAFDKELKKLTKYDNKVK